MRLKNRREPTPQQDTGLTCDTRFSHGAYVRTQDWLAEVVSTSHLSFLPHLASLAASSHQQHDRRCKAA